MGRVLDDSSRQGVREATVAIPKLGLVSTADSAGGFSLKGIPAGSHLTIVRALGFRAETVYVDLGQDEAFSRDFLLERLPVELGRVEVIASSESPTAGKLAGFKERQRSQVGNFLDSTRIAQWSNRRFGDLMSLLPGVDLQRAGGKAYAVGSRAQPSLLAPRQADPCYMDIYLDGALVYTKAMAGSPPFDLNSITTDHVAAVESYSSTARIPAQFNKTSKGCGVLVIWTR